jgi:hypothetical protein
MSTSRTDLNALQSILVSSLMERIKNGEATAADFNVARQLLKDNGVSVPPLETERELHDLASVLPFADFDRLQVEAETLQ